MDIDIKILTGDLKMMDVSFSFVFDGEILKLIPLDPEDVFRLQNEEIKPGVYAYRGFPKISENVLTGHCNENGQRIVFIVPIGASISSYNHILEIEPLAYIVPLFRKDNKQNGLFLQRTQSYLSDQSGI